ncbi:MAG: putative lipid II flippase FtsW [Thiotrichales bacterium]|nr:putative lipid II flippase FtsW [Thiotrichales bacterium]
MSAFRQQAVLKNVPAAELSFLRRYDGWLLGVIVFLLLLGLTMVTSSSVSIADRIYQDPLYYFWRQLIAVVSGVAFALLVMRMPLQFWQTISVPLLALGVLLLILVLMPGIGKEVNGSMRWISLGPIAFQASEPVKLCIIAYMAGYLVRQNDQVKTSFAGFIRPIAVVTAISGLLLLEPDYGACIVLFATTLGMLFLAGVPLSRFFTWVLAASMALATLAVLSPYRMQRLMSFIDPWQDPFNTGFQLTQALIAFGRGDWFGVGLGSSVQKLFYLPEAHTDFVFAVLAEELGLLGVVVVILLFGFLVIRSLIIGQMAESSGQLFAGYFAYGIGLLLGVQSFINIGVNMGLLPTKGLTLPLMSYGGNSVFVTCVLLGILLRIEYENRAAFEAESAKTVTTYVA